MLVVPAENVTTAAEGFVFDYDGYTYKFTGNFAPMNQLLGLFQYGRGNIPAMQLSEAQTDGIENVVAIYPGRFQPMGRHHAQAFKWLQDQFGEENAYVATSNVVNPPKSPLNFEEKKEAMLAHGIPGSQIVQVKNPYKAEEILTSYDPETTSVAFMVGNKDMEGDPRFRVGEKKRGGPVREQRAVPKVLRLRTKRGQARGVELPQAHDAPSRERGPPSVHDGGRYPGEQVDRGS